MRTFLRVVLLLSLVVYFPLWIFFTSIVMSGVNAAWVKNELSKTGTYPKLVSGLDTAIAASLNNEKTTEDVKTVLPMVQKIITAEFIQIKLEKLIDDGFSWFNGKTHVAPSISIVEFKDVLIAQNPDLAKQLQIKTTAEDTKPISVDPEYDYGVAHVSASSATNQAINNKLTISLEKYFVYGKTILTYGAYVYRVISVLLLFTLVGIFLLSQTAKSGICWIGVTGFFAVFCNILPYLLLLSPTLIISVLSSRFGNEFVMLGSILLKPFLVTIVSQETKISFMILGFSFVIVLVSLFMKSKPETH